MFRFEHAEYAYLLPLIVLLPALYFFGQRLRRKALLKFGNAALAERLFPKRNPRSAALKLTLWTVGVLSLVVALANPQLGGKREMVKSAGIEVFIALDVSQSMLAEDLAPSRLRLAQRFAEELVRSLQGNKLGLILFAGNAYLQVPLTTDYAAVALFLQSAHPDMLPEQGTELSAALDLAGRSFSKQARTSRAVVLISDGENHEEEAVRKVHTLSESGTYTFAVGAGTTEGSLIPLMANGGLDYKRDPNGIPIRSAMNESLLKEIAREGQGTYSNLSGDMEPILESLATQIDRIEKRELEQRVFSSYESYFQPFLLLALLCFLWELLLSVRQKAPKARGGVTALILLSAQTTYAQSGHTLLREGDKQYQKRDYAGAEERYRKALEDSGTPGRYNLGNAIYQQKRFPEAAKHFAQAAKSAPTAQQKASAYYNLGNALYQMKDYGKSIEAYKNALRIHPADLPSKQNLELARRKLQQQQQQQQQQQNQNQKDSPKDQNQPREEPQNKRSDQQSSPPPQGQQPPKQPQSQENSPRDLSRKEAEDLLRAAENEEKRVQAKMRKGQGKPGKPDKDW
ncbi:MAG: VWA domain-containing protein [Haliscomenobacter sp.]